MKSFLAEVISEIYSRHPKNLQDLILVLPSKRAGAFLKKELKGLIVKTTFLPTIYSIEEFVQEIANLKQANNLELLFELYQTYCHLIPPEHRDTLYEFTSWGTTAIQDFNEIDRYLIDPDKVFDHLFNIKELDHWTHAEEKTTLQENYLNFWKELKTLYHDYTAALTAKGLGYQGMIYREASEQVEYYLQANQERPHYFIGFNALNKAESAILQEILANCEGEIYWDIDREFMEDADHDASLFLRSIKTEWPHIQKNGFKYIADHYHKPKKIDLIGIPGNIQQAKYIGNLLTSIHNEEGTIENTAVVLGQEALLPAILNAIPGEIENINITSGFPLQHTPFASLFDTLMQSWHKTQHNKWYYRDLDSILTHPAAQGILPQPLINKGLEAISKENIIYVTTNRIHELFSNAGNSNITLLFPDLSHANINDLIKNCSELTLKLRDHYNEQEHHNPVYLQYLYRFFQVFNQLGTIQEKYHTVNDLRALLQVYRDLLVKETIDFQGEPLSGLQVMGMLESRNLDFDRVIISSVNEGVLPGGKSQNSFLPFDLKIHYGLPTYKEKDAVYTYHFYRLLQRAKKVHLLYNTATDTLDGGEKSRFIQQLLLNHHPEHRIREILASPTLTTTPKELISLTKSEGLHARLKQVAGEGFSPSSLTNYIRNPLDFYKQRVLGIKEMDMVEETVAANTMGTIVHDSLEELFTPYIGKELIPNDIAVIRKNLESVVTKNFTLSYSTPETARGQNLISFHVAKKYVEKYLDYEATRLKDGKKIRILALENDVPVQLDIPGLDFPVKIKGKVDRIEEVDGVWTVVDYKTGAVQPGDLKIYDWDLMLEDYKYSKAFQVLCYVYMMRKSIPEHTEVQAGIISLKSIGNQFMPFAKADAPRARNAIKKVTPEILDEFESKLFKLIREICDISIPFTEKEIKSHDY